MLIAAGRTAMQPTTCQTTQPTTSVVGKETPCPDEDETGCYFSKGVLTYRIKKFI